MLYNVPHADLCVLCVPAALLLHGLQWTTGPLTNRTVKHPPSWFRLGSNRLKLPKLGDRNSICKSDHSALPSTIHFQPPWSWGHFIGGSESWLDATRIVIFVILYLLMFFFPPSSPSLGPVFPRICTFVFKVKARAAHHFTGNILNRQH